MARIEPYTIQSTPQGPVAQQQATAGAVGDGSAWETLGQSLTQAGGLLERRKEQVELSDLNAKMSEFHARMTNAWRETLAKTPAGDSDMAQNFMETFDNEASAIGDNIETRVGQQYYKDSLARTREHFSQTASVGQAGKASQFAVENMTNAFDQNAASVFHEPGAYKTVLANQMQSITDQEAHGAFKGQKDIADKLKLEFKTKLAISAVRGQIDKNPALALTQLHTKMWDDVGPNLKMLVGEAEAGIRAQRVNATLKDLEDKKVLKEKNEQTWNDLFDKMDKGKPSNADILGQGLPHEQVIQAIHMMNYYADQKGKFRGDAQLENGLYQGIIDGSITDREQVTAHFGVLGPAQTSFLLKTLANEDTPQGKADNSMLSDFYKVKFAQIVGKTDMHGNILEPEKGDKYLSFKADMQTAIEKGLRNGIPLRSLLNPENKEHYVAKDIRPYMSEFQKNMMSRTKGINMQVGGGTPPPPSKPLGPTSKKIEDFLKKQREEGSNH